MESVGHASLAASRPASLPGVAGDLVRSVILALIEDVMTDEDDVDERLWKSVVSLTLLVVEEVEDLRVDDLSGDLLGDLSGDDRVGDEVELLLLRGGDLLPLELDVTVVTRVVMTLLVGDLVVVVVVTFSVTASPSRLALVVLLLLVCSVSVLSSCSLALRSCVRTRRRCS